MAGGERAWSPLPTSSLAFLAVESCGKGIIVLESSCPDQSNSKLPTDELASIVKCLDLAKI